MALIRKIIESTLIAGQTDITFTDVDIPNSLLRVYATLDSLFPISQTITGNSIKITYEAQSSNVGIALEIVKEGLQVIDSLESEDTNNALSANQGKQLKTLIDNIVIPTVPDNITDLNDVEVTDITNNQVLAWDAIDSKFKNVDQSGGGGGGEVYSDQETVVGTFTLEGVTKPVYRKLIAFGNLPNNTTKSVAHGIQNLGQVLRIDSIGAGNADFPSGTKNFYFPGLFGNNLAYTLGVAVTATNVVVRTYADFRWGIISYVILTYIKTVD